ncbi:hypothetical protein OHB44_28000 [Micromonospora sp. NBC_00821]|uniref:hypothetical protein n=1 Tax=Micromonospora sp. NBC_00821 TaxID=2975977 RepID=UPI002ED0EA52|nr:hypothetical protein OHB44_28000 [Micromonospora sp. NBC_00821]
MDIKFCKRQADGCYEPAVGTGIRPVEFCRPHYLEAIADEIVRAEVIGDVRVTDVRTGESVGRGQVVELDPEETRIVQLVYARHIKVLPKADPPAAVEANPTLGDETASKPAAKRG